MIHFSHKQCKVFLIIIVVLTLNAVCVTNKRIFDNYRKPRNINSSPAWSLSPKKPWVLEGGSVTLELYPLEESPNVNSFIQCNVSNANSSFVLPPGSDQKEFSIADGRPDRLVIVRTLYGGCSAVFRDVTTVTGGKWNIMADQRFSGSTDISVISPPTTFATLYTSIGVKKSIECASSGAPTLYYCQILNNTHQVVSNYCSYYINPVRKEHVGNWTCLMAFKGTMVHYKYITSLVLQADELVEGKTFKEGNKTILECSVSNTVTRFSWCRAISPQGKTLLLSPGLVQGRYSAVYTSPETNLCSLEIQTPLASDYGLWRIEIGLNADDYTGCFLNVPHSTRSVKNIRAAVVSESLNSGPVHTVVKVGENLQLKCNVPWPSSYCYAIKPDGTPIRQNNGGGSVDRLLRIGVCVVKASNLSIHDAGRWICGLSSNDGSEDIHFYTDVEVMSGALKPLLTGFAPVSGGSAVLLCRSPIHQPLKYCRFTNPQGKGFSLIPNIVTESRFSYFGAGLDEGECGVRISEVTDEDIGTWTCAATFISQSVEEFTTITITALEHSTGFKVGVGIGSATILTLLIILSTVVYRRRQIKISEEHQRILRETPANSTEHMADGGQEVSRAVVQEEGRVVFAKNKAVQRHNVTERNEIN